MILRFNPNLFYSNDRKILSDVSKIILEVIDDKFMWEQENFDEIFLSDDEENFFKPFSDKWLSVCHKEDLIEKINQICEKDAYMTSAHKKYLNVINVGTGLNELHPKLVLQILTMPSKIIIENATNDWKFIESISNLYCKNKARKEIYKLVKKAVDNRWLIAEQAGGKTQIISRIKDLESNLYQGILKHKIATLFDSDRNNNIELKREQKLIIGFIKNKTVSSLQDAVNEHTDKIIWHILYKRELENYVPKNVLLENTDISIDDKNKIRQLSESDYDFIDFESQIKSVDNIKKVFPELFLTHTKKDDLEQRCAHHKVFIDLPNGTQELISEMEQILLKIAKII